MNKSVEVKISKSGHPVPLVDSIHLHSIYNPQKEAESFALSNEKKIHGQGKILIFGLAFGYHVEAIEKRLKYLHPEEYEIVVIEPNQATFNHWKDLRPTTFSSRVRVLCQTDLNDYFSDQLLLDFLVQKPSVISHTASFELHEEFFKEFMGFKYSTTNYASSEFVKDKHLREYLQEQNMHSTQELISSINNKKSLSEWDFITKAIGVITEKD